MKILIVGNFYSPIYEQALFNAFSFLKHDIFKFAICDYFGEYLSKTPTNAFSLLKWFYYKTQNKFLFGPVVLKINSDLICQTHKIKPDLIFIYQGLYLFPKTIKKLKGTGTLVFGYVNDDPFSKKHLFYLWRHFKKSIPYYDHIFVYRHKNIEDFKRLNYYRLSLLRSYYIKEKNFSIKKLPTDEYFCDVLFAGHWEDDKRNEYLKAIIDNGIDLKIFGPEWQRSRYYKFFNNKLNYQIRSLNLEDYNLALNSARIALCFLSKLNNDTYTRRNFEIPAAQTFMLSEYSDDLASLFEPEKEAEYFKTKEEMLSKIKYYLAHDSERESIARAGYQRLLRDGHEVRDRVKEIIKVFNSYNL